MLNPTSTSHENISGGGQMAFLRRLTQDDRFRATLEADPQASLAEYGLNVDPGQLPSKVTLPKAESILGILNDTDDVGGDGHDDDLFSWFGYIGSARF